MSLPVAQRGVEYTGKSVFKKLPYDIKERQILKLHSKVNFRNFYSVTSTL